MGGVRLMAGRGEMANRAKCNALRQRVVPQYEPRTTGKCPFPARQNGR